MADGLPWPVAGGVGTSLAAAVGVLWRALGKERDGCEKRVAKVEERIERLEREMAEAAAKAAREVQEWQGRWIREVELGVQRYAAPSPAIPTRPPQPSFDENTEVRRIRSAVEQIAIDKELEKYVRSSKPPRGI